VVLDREFRSNFVTVVACGSLKLETELGGTQLNSEEGSRGQINLRCAKETEEKQGFHLYSGLNTGESPREFRVLARVESVMRDRVREEEEETNQLGQDREVNQGESVISTRFQYCSSAARGPNDSSTTEGCCLQGPITLPYSALHTEHQKKLTFG
jgi:hypothetical protein